MDIIKIVMNYDRSAPDYPTRISFIVSDNTPSTWLRWFNPTVVLKKQYSAKSIYSVITDYHSRTCVHKFLLSLGAEHVSLGRYRLSYDLLALLKLRYETEENTHETTV